MSIDPLASPGVAERVRALPGTLTFHDLVRRNRRQSAFLVVVMMLLTAAVGAAVAGSISLRASGVEWNPARSVAIGAAAGLAAAVLATLWSWFSGASAILAMSGAHELRRQDDPELFNVIDELCLVAAVPTPRVFLINDTAMNAFATGRDPAHAAVAITRGLRARLTRDELQGVMAHEMAHVRHLDIRFAMLMATMVGLIAFTCDALLRVAWHGGAGRRRWGGGRERGGGAGVILLLVALVLAIVAPLAATIVQMAYSRRREYLADAGAVELTRNPLGLASALAKLADDHEPLVDTANRGTAHMYIVNPLRRMRDAGQALNSLFLSHPPIKERIARLVALTR